MPTTLVIVMNSNNCKMYDYTHQPEHTLTLIKEIDHPENKLKTSDLMTDKPGHFKTDGGGRGSYSPPHTPKEVNIDHFTQEVAHTLNHLHTQQKYKKCILIAPPHMEGALIQHIHKPIEQFITSRIQKSVSYLHEHELLTFLKEHEHDKK